MVIAMREHELVGIAAPQVGVSLQIFITEIRKTRFRKKLKNIDTLKVYINPKIISRSRNQTLLVEGCGSVSRASLFGTVKRPSAVTVTARDEQGKKFERKTKGLLAKIVQHEYDHLEGRLCSGQST